MAAGTILLFGDPRLEAPNQGVESFDSELKDLVEALFETGWRAPGLGVAAPQIGHNLRIAVVDLSVGKDPCARLVLANPCLLATRGRVALEEGCLSFPGLFPRVVRPRWVKVTARDLRGRPITLEAEGVLAQAFCHEIDHLDGRLLVHNLRGVRRALFMHRLARLRGSDSWHC